MGNTSIRIFVKSSGAIRKLFLLGVKRSSICCYVLTISGTSLCPESTVAGQGIKNWPIWILQVISFDWTNDDKEICLLLESQVKVTPNGGVPVKFSEGDWIVFPNRMYSGEDVHKVVCKYYRFGG